MPAIVLINPESGSAEQFDHIAAPQALQSGYHVPLVDQEGNPYAAPYEEAQQLVQSGTHIQPNSKQLQSLLETAHYNSTPQQALAFVEGALEPLSAGVYGRVADATGLTSKEEILNRQQHNPGTHALGEMAGIGLGIGLAPETSIPGLIGRAGKAAAGAIEATGTFGKAAQIATQGAIEGGLFAATHKASEALLGDPNANAENILSDIGISAALGGGLNLALAPAFSAINKSIGLGRGYVGRMTGSDNAPEEIEAIKDLIPHMGMPEEERQGILEGLSKRKSNAKEIESAAARLNVPLLESQISDSKVVQDFDGSLLKSDDSWVGIKRQQLAQEQYSGISKSIDSALGNDIGMTKAQVGDEIKNGLTDILSEESKPITELYNSVKQMGETVPLSKNTLKSVSKDMTNIDGLLSSKGTPLSEKSPGYQLANRASKEIKNLGTVDDLRRYSETIGRDSIGKPELKYAAGQIRQKLSELEEKSILGYARERFPEGSIERSQVEGLIEQHGLAKKQYASLRDKMEELGSVIGKKLRKGEGPQAFLDWLSETAPEKIADKLFTKNNSKFLDFLQTNYPKEAELLSNLKKSQLRDSAMVDGIVRPNKVIKELDKLEPEIRKFLFTRDDLQKIEDAKTLLESFPKDINPSGTAKTLRLFDLLDPTKTLSIAGRQVSDYLKLKTIQQLVRGNPADAPLISALSHLSQMSAKTYRAIERYSGSIFSRPIGNVIEEKNKEKEITPSSEPLKLNKIGTEVMNHINNPEQLVNHLTNATGTISEYAPNTTAALTGSVGRAVSFLSSKVPPEGKQAPFDAPRKYSNAEIAKFNRYALMVEKPVEVLKRIRDGTLLKQDIETVATVYPSLYNKMRETLMGKLIETSAKDKKIPYNTRLGLSLFLGQNLDSTMSTQGIQFSQMALAANQAQKQMNEMQQTKPSKSGMRQMKSINQDLTAAQQANFRHGRNS